MVSYTKTKDRKRIKFHEKKSNIYFEQGGFVSLAFGTRSRFKKKSLSFELFNREPFSILVLES